MQIHRDSVLESQDGDSEKLRVLATYAPESVSSSHNSSSDEEVDDPNVEYAKVKVKIEELKGTRYRNDVDADPVLAHLQSRLDRLKSHYFFRARDADTHYFSEKALADRRMLEKKLSGETEEDITTYPIVSAVRSAPASNKDFRPPHLKPTDQTTGTTYIDLFEEEGSPDAIGGIFGTLLDTMPESEVTDGVQVQIRDMALPKHWAGRTPKILLSETVQKADRYAIISYRLLPDSRTSRAKRAAVTVRWAGAKTDEWLMDDVGCWDEGQAEQYISTLALHDVTFGHSEGFAGGGHGGSGGSGQTYFRLLPPVFRDLWDELELKRRAADDERNRDAWAILRRVLEPKLGAEKKVCFYRILNRVLTLLL